jgi:uncharacterized protein involved in exopolysaccharide biosynthesis
MSKQTPQPVDGKAGDSPSEETVSGLDLLVLLARGRSLLFGTVAVFVVVGLAYGLLASTEYMASAQVVPEAQSDAAQGLGSLGGGLSALQGLGVNLGSLSSQGLSTDSYPEIAKSREVRLAVVRDTFQIPEEDTTMALVDHYTRGEGLLSGAIQAVKRTVSGPDTLRERDGEDIPTLKEERAMGALEKQITAYQSPETGLMNLSVTTGNAQLSAAVVESLIEHLSNRVRSLRTEKARRNLKFIQQRFQEAEKELTQTEKRLADFTDRNQNINTAQLRTQRDRLQRQVRFKSDLYSELQAQLTQAKIDLQRSEPVITVVEQPVPPLEPVAPQRLVILIVSLLGGGIAGCVLVFLRAYFREENATGERRAKIREVREAFIPADLVERGRRYLTGEKKETRSAD